MTIDRYFARVCYDRALEFCGLSVAPLCPPWAEVFQFGPRADEFFNLCLDLLPFRLATYEPLTWYENPGVRPFWAQFHAPLLGRFHELLGARCSLLRGDTERGAFVERRNALPTRWSHDNPHRVLFDGRVIGYYDFPEIYVPLAQDRFTVARGDAPH